MSEPNPDRSQTPPTGALHHVEIWVPNLERARAEWGWLLESLGYQRYQDWEDGTSWRLGPTYLVFEQSPALSGTEHDRCAPGLNHLAFHVGTPTEVDELVRTSAEHGWTQLFEDRYPYAGGDDHYAGYLSNSDGYEVELVTTS